MHLYTQGSPVTRCWPVTGRVTGRVAFEWMGERWRAAPGGERQKRKARGDDRWPAAIDAVYHIFAVQLTILFFSVIKKFGLLVAMAVVDGFDRAHGALNIKTLMQRSVLLGAHRLSLASKIGRALRTALFSKLSARRAIAPGAHELDFSAVPNASLVSTQWRSASRGGQRKAPG
eukprot:20549-Pleurochrysis_carterae.AAC.1